MYILKKEEDAWWLARHSDGRMGLIPVPYIKQAEVRETTVTVSGKYKVHSNTKFHCGMLRRSLRNLCFLSLFAVNKTLSVFVKELFRLLSDVKLLGTFHLKICP